MYGQDIVSPQAMEEVTKNNFEPALAELKTVLLLDSEREDALVLRANIFIRMQRNDEALTDIQKILKTNPKNAEAQFMGGVAAIYSDKKRLAEQFFNNCLLIKSDFTAALLFRGKMYIESGDFTLALVDFNKIIELEPENLEAYFHRGRVYIGKLNYVLALKNLIKVIDSSPKGSKLREVAMSQFEIANKGYEEFSNGGDPIYIQSETARTK